MLCSRKNLRSPPQPYINDEGNSPRSLARAFGISLGNYAMPRTASALAGRVASSNTAADGHPPWAFRK